MCVYGILCETRGEKIMSLVIDKDIVRAGVDQYPSHEIAIANWFLERAAKESIELTHSVLQVLVQLSYGAYFIEYKVMLFEATPITGSFGPFLPSLASFYNNPDGTLNGSSLRIFQDDAIEVLDLRVRPSEDELNLLSEKEREKKLQVVQQIERILDSVWWGFKLSTQSQFGFCLSGNTSPYNQISEQTNVDSDDGRSVFINHEDIQKYFLKLWGKVLANEEQKKVGSEQSAR
jgi:uncharacterized phage-associated protein